MMPKKQFGQVEIFPYTNLVDKSMWRENINYLRVLTEASVSVSTEPLLTTASASISERQYMLIPPQTLVFHVTKEDI